MMYSNQNQPANDFFNSVKFTYQVEKKSVALSKTTYKNIPVDEKWLNDHPEIQRLYPDKGAVQQFLKQIRLKTMDKYASMVYITENGYNVEWNFMMIS